MDISSDCRSVRVRIESTQLVHLCLIYFRSFIRKAYQSYQPTLFKKASRRSNVVDMSLIWLWWVSHQNETSYISSIPWKLNNSTATIEEIRSVREKGHNAYKYTKSLPLPESNSTLRICNGLQVANRHVFDHAHGWAFGQSFSLNLNSPADENYGVPYVIGECLGIGGSPETTDPVKVKELQHQKLFFNSLHYQGDSKRLLPFDVCRILYKTGSGTILNPEVRALCAKEMDNRQGVSCLNHIGDAYRVVVCA